MKTLAPLLALVIVALAAGCGDDTTPAPTPDLWQPRPDTTSNACATCSGCCFGGNQCMPGTSVAACGFGGLTCQTCGGTDECVNGTCAAKPPQCDATTCPTGCCSSAGVCIQPATDVACGTGGATCKACAATETCKAGTCQTAGPTTYKVKIVSAEVSNSDCGWLDDCDPYAEVALGGGAVVTTTKLDATEKPVWDFELLRRDRQGAVGHAAQGDGQGQRWHRQPRRRARDLRSDGDADGAGRRYARLRLRDEGQERHLHLHQGRSVSAAPASCSSPVCWARWR